jgi:N4-(beta-N-acetylglucosaminyl)-L-asparaginase
MSINRRQFIVTSATALPLGSLAVTATSSTPRSTPTLRNTAGPLAIASANGLRTVARAVELMNGGTRPVEACVEGVAIQEDDPTDNSVGYGGLPNEDGVVQLDSSCMDGPMHKAGAVACIENIKNPARVALAVLRRTDHVLLVGEGAYQFARRLGFPHEELLTEESRQAWLRWKANLNPGDDWLDNEQRIRFDDEERNGSGNGDADLISRRVGDPREEMARLLGVPWTWGTIHCSGLNDKGDLGCCTTTSGLSYKIPGRVGDSPLVGAGMFCDNEVGSAGATGRGEAVIKSCGSFQIVNYMRNGDEPADACVKVLRWIAEHTKRAELLNERGEPNFDVKLYAVRKDGLYGSASMRKGGTFAVADSAGARIEECAYLYER